MATRQSKQQSSVDEFIEHVRARIDETGITISDLARQSKVTRPYIHRILAGEQVPTLTVAEALAKVLGLKITTLLSHKNGEAR